MLEGEQLKLILVYSRAREFIESYSVVHRIARKSRESQGALVVKYTAASAGEVSDVGSIVGQEDPLEEGMATHSSILAWRIPWTEEPGGLRSIGSKSCT